jgi:hypothetical protein
LGLSHENNYQDITPRPYLESWNSTPALLEPNSFVPNTSANGPPGHHSPFPVHGNIPYHNKPKLSDELGIGTRIDLEPSPPPVPEERWCSELRVGLFDFLSPATEINQFHNNGAQPEIEYDQPTQANQHFVYSFSSHALYNISRLHTSSSPDYFPHQESTSKSMNALENPVIDNIHTGIKIHDRCSATGPSSQPNRTRNSTLSQSLEKLVSV